jgi:CheY-like chemotaxis protein
MAASSATVLVVDDDEGLLRLIEKILCRAGCRPIGVVSGELALAALEQNSVDLVLMDLGLPNLDGRELASQLATRTPRVPFVVITGRADVPTAVDLMKRGALDYVMKDAQFIDFCPASSRTLWRTPNANAGWPPRRRNSVASPRNSSNASVIARPNWRRRISGCRKPSRRSRFCKDVRDANDEWHPIERYISQRSDLSFSHGVCPKCLQKHYPEFADDVLSKMKAIRRSATPAAEAGTADGR